MTKIPKAIADEISVEATDKFMYANTLMSSESKELFELKHKVFCEGGAKGFSLAMREAQILIEALNNISAYNKPIGREGHKGPDDDQYWYKQELMSRDFADKVLAQWREKFKGEE